MKLSALKKIICFSALISLFSALTFADDEDDTASTNTSSVEITSENSAQIAISNPDYLVTPGDIYTLSYAAGKTPVSYTIVVDTTYNINVSNLAKINAKGKTYLQVKSQVEDIVAKNYPFSGVQFILTNPAVFKIIVDGEVTATKEKTVLSLTRLSEVINDSITEYSSCRDITVTSIDGTKKSYDLFLSERFGDMSQNPYVRPGETVTVGKMKRKVSIDGAVERPGIYELKDGENLKSLIEYYGNGIKETADLNRIELTRTYTDSRRNQEKFYFNEDDVNNDKELFCYDSVYISDYQKFTSVITLEGAVGEEESSTAPSGTEKYEIPFTEGENYAFLIRRMAKRFNSYSDLENSYIIRKGEVIKIDASKCLYERSYFSDYVLEPYDILIIPFKQLFVTVAGAVVSPGRVPYIPDRNWNYYVTMCGGFTEANAGNAVKIMDMDHNKLSKDSAILPETIITAEKNSFLYNFNRIAPVITTTLSIISAGLTLYLATK